MNLVRHGLGFSKTESRFPAKGTCHAIYSRCVNAGEPLAETLRDHFPWCAAWEAELKRLFAAYVAAKQAQNVLDYDDLLLAWAQVMEEPGFAAHIGALWDHVLIDEYQDTNRLQARILLALKPDGRGLTVVGDDAQAIYTFLAATVRNILDFPAAFAPPALVVTLDRNYRSTQAIPSAANRVIAGAAERFTKDLWTDRTGEKPRLVTLSTEADQARFFVDEVLANREEGMRLKDQAVLFRTSSHSGQIEVELTRRNVPFVKFGGLKFLDSAHIKDLLALLRFVQNPRDRVAGFRVLQLVPGVGPVAAGRALDAVAAEVDPLEALTALPPPPRSGAEWTGLVAALPRLGKDWPAGIAPTVLVLEVYPEARGTGRGFGISTGTNVEGTTQGGHRRRCHLRRKPDSLPAQALSEQRSEGDQRAEAHYEKKPGQEHLEPLPSVGLRWFGPDLCLGLSGGAIGVIAGLVWCPGHAVSMNSKSRPVRDGASPPARTSRWLVATGLSGLRSGEVGRKGCQPRSIRRGGSAERSASSASVSASRPLRKAATPLPTSPIMLETLPLPNRTRTATAMTRRPGRPILLIMSFS